VVRSFFWEIDAGMCPDEIDTWTTCMFEQAIQVWFQDGRAYFHTLYDCKLAVMYAAFGPPKFV
jgi:hypothetical protein